MEEPAKGNSKFLARAKGLWSDLKAFYNELPPAFLLAAILALTIFVASRPATSIERPWAHFQIFQSSILAIGRSIAFRSIAAPLTILTMYGGLYYVFGVRGRRFIVVSDFRVWGQLEKKTPEKGVAARLQDELMRL